MEESLEHRKAKRAGHRGVVTRYLQETRSLLDKETIDNKTQRRLGVLRGLLQDKSEVLKRLDEEILAGCATENIEGEIIEADEISSKIIETLTEMRSVVEPSERGGISRASSAHVTPTTEHGGEDPINTSVRTKTDRGRAKPKLPKLILSNLVVTSQDSEVSGMVSKVQLITMKSFHPLTSSIICKPLLRVQLQNVYRVLVCQKQTIQQH